MKRLIFSIILILGSSLSYANVYPTISRFVQYSTFTNSYSEQQYVNKVGFEYGSCSNPIAYTDYEAYYQFSLGTVSSGYRIKTMQLQITRNYIPNQLGCSSEEEVVVSNPGSITSLNGSYTAYNKIAIGSPVGTMHANQTSIDILSSYSDQGGIVNIGLYGVNDSKVFNISGVSLYIETEQIDNPPAKPQNLEVYSINYSYPYLTWSRNNETDVTSSNAYCVYRNGGFLSYVAQSNNGVDPVYTDTEIAYDGSDWGIYGLECTYTVKVKDNGGQYSPASDPYTLSVDLNNRLALEKNGNSETTDIKLDYNLEPNYPNPFNPTTQISYQIAEDGFVSLGVYNALGQKVANLVNQQQSIGSYSVKFDATDLPSGVYIYKLQVNEFSSTKKMLLTK